MYERAPLQETTFISRSQNSIAHYSEQSIADSYDSKKAGYDSCLTRVPYATLIATLMCVLGVVIFCSTMYRGSTLSIIMFEQVFKRRLFWIEAVQMTFVVIGACMGALGLMILAVGFLATGATRHKVYRAWRSRVGGRITCAVFMVITYILQIAWILMFCFLAIVSFVFTIFWCMCSNPSVERKESSIDFTQFYFMFPKDTKQEHMKITEAQDIKYFCRDGVENAVMMFIVATSATVLIILSLVHYLMCLSANYAHIRDHEKFQELQDLHYLTDPDMVGSKDRF